MAAEATLGKGTAVPAAEPGLHRVMGPRLLLFTVLINRATGVTRADPAMDGIGGTGPVN